MRTNTSRFPWAASYLDSRRSNRSVSVCSTSSRSERGRHACQRIWPLLQRISAAVARSIGFSAGGLWAWDKRKLLPGREERRRGHQDQSGAQARGRAEAKANTVLVPTIASALRPADGRDGLLETRGRVPSQPGSSAWNGRPC